MAPSTIPCEKCGIECDPDGAEGVDCPECSCFFCDNCYDTGMGDGCKCHEDDDDAEEN